MALETFSHSLRRIANEPVRDDPFPHFYINGIFPEEIFSGIHTRWPRPSDFQDSKTVGNIERERFYFRLEPENIARLDPEGRIFWEDFATWLQGTQLLEVTFDKYRAHISANLELLLGRAFLNAAEVEPLVRFNTSLAWDITGYRLLPHADDPRVLLNLLFYAPRDETQVALGTTIYVPKCADLVSRGEPRHSREEFDAVVTFPYLPNSVFSFVRTPKSFHGMEGIETEQTERKLILYSVMLMDDVARDAGLVF